MRPILRDDTPLPVRTDPRLPLVVAPLALALGVRIAIGGQPAFTTDDAYISLHSARHLLETVDPSFIGSRPLHGATSPLHVFVLAAVMAARIPPLWAVELVTWVGASLYLLGAATLVCRRVPSAPWRVALMLLTAFVSYTPMHLSNGQETPFAMAAVMWTLVWLDDDAPGRVRLPVLAGLLVWLRPDLLVLTLLVLVTRWRSAPEARRRDALLTMAGIAAWLVVNSWTIGSPVPNTMMAKSEFFAFYGFPWWFNTIVGGTRLWWFIRFTGPAVVSLVWCFSRPNDRLIGVALLVTILALGVQSSIVLDHNFFRYLHPLVCTAMLAGFTVLVSSRPRTALAVVSASLLAIGVMAPERWRDYRRSQVVVVDLQGAIAGWINANAPDATVLIHDAGMLSEFTRARLVDMVGLKMPAATVLHRRFTGPTQGRGRGDALHALACETQPTLYVAFNTWEQLFRLSDGLRTHGWGVNEVFHREIQALTGPQRFTLYRLTPPASCPAGDGLVSRRNQLPVDSGS